MEEKIIEQSHNKLYDDLLEVVEPYLSDFIGYDEKEQCFNIVLAVKELLGQLEQESENLKEELATERLYSSQIEEFEESLHKLKKENEELKKELKIQKDISSSNLELYKRFGKTVLHNQGVLNSIPITEEEEFYLSHTNEQAEQIKYFINKYKHALEEIRQKIDDCLYCDCGECKYNAFDDCRTRLLKDFRRIITKAIGE